MVHIKKKKSLKKKTKNQQLPQSKSIEFLCEICEISFLSSSSCLLRRGNSGLQLLCNIFSLEDSMAGHFLISLPTWVLPAPLPISFFL